MKEKFDIGFSGYNYRIEEEISVFRNLLFFIFSYVFLFSYVLYFMRIFYIFLCFSLELEK